MPENIELSHHRNYTGIYKAGKIGTLVCFGLTLLLVFVIIVAKSPQSLAVFVLFLLSIISVVVCFTFLLFWLIYAGKIKRSGSYEAIDILNNRLYYRSERSGLLVIAPEQIERIKMQKVHRSVIYGIEIFFKDTDNTLICPDSVTGYDELVKKLRSFVNDNNIPLIR